MEIQESPKTQVCKSCGRELPLDRFKRNHISKTGYVQVCSECVKFKASKASSPSRDNAKVFEKIVDPRFSQFESRELIAELRRRGYRGELQIMQKISV